MQEICKYIDCISQICKKYAVKICRNMQFYMQHTQKSTCCIFCIYSTPHGGEGPVEKPSLSATIFSVFSTSQGKQWPSRLFCRLCAKTIP